MILWIGVVHGLPVLLAAIFTRRRVPSWIVAIAMAIIGIATGSPLYMLVDLGGVAVAMMLGQAFFPASNAGAAEGLQSFQLPSWTLVKRVITVVLLGFCNLIVWGGLAYYLYRA